MNTKISPWYITGFVEGEGAFTFSRNGKTVNPLFSIRQRGDYSGLVRLIAGYFGVGSIYECAARPPTQASTYYRISKLKELPVVINHFKKYPMASKSKQQVFLKWAAMIRLKSKTKRSCRSLIRGKLIQMARELSSLQMRPRGFRTRELNPPAPVMQAA